MDSSAMLAEAYQLVQQDLYHHLEQAEYLAEDDWTDEKVELARALLPELCSVIRGVLAAHRPDSGGACATCGHRWPCSVVTLIHGLVKDPEFHFVRLLESQRY
jgi:hypothetical protein